MNKNIFSLNCYFVFKIDSIDETTFKALGKKITNLLRCVFHVHKVFFSLLKDEQHLSVNDIGLTNLGQNIKAAKSTVPHKVKPKQREINN